MGISLLRPFLQSLCCSSPWNYAVFWKLKYHHEMVLVWEDGFCNSLKPQDPIVSQIEDANFENSNKVPSSKFTSTVLDGTPGECPVGLAVSEMSSVSHVVGEGVVGKAALTGNVCWIYSHNITTDASNSVLVPEYPDEWVLQVAAGVKTILLLPVIPHGVLQLGSVEMVAEEGALVAKIKDKFEAHKAYDEYDWRYSNQELSLMSTLMECLEEPPIFTLEKAIRGQNAIHAVRTKDCNITANQVGQMFMVQDFHNTSVRRGEDTLENATESKFSQQPLGMIHAADPRPLLCEDTSYITENDVLTCYHDEKLWATPYCDNFDSRMHVDFMNGLMDSHFEEGETQASFVGSGSDSAICESGGNLFCFPGGDYELQEALGTLVEGNTSQTTYGASISSHDVAYLSVGDRKASCNMDVSGAESIEFPPKELEIENLLEVVASACNTFDDNLSNKSTVDSLNMSSRQRFTSSKRRDRSKQGGLVEEDKVPWDFLTSKYVGQGINTTFNFSSVSSVVESTIGASSDKLQQRKGYDSLNPGKLSRLSATNRRRARTGDNRRPRPRDRQMIQDRIKELRELVPNSEKCSIDGLLDKTIKHIHFLRGVTNRADKLRHQVFEEEAHEKRTRSAEVSYGHQNGTSWALEVGSEQQMCPIIVKDLDFPGYMLIEMLCTDYGRFLEIANVIHHLQLTILKGVMEKNIDGSWASFVVETSGNFHRLDIFWPLMQLLQQNRAPVAA